MLSCPNSFIENFAMMLENGCSMNENEIAERTMKILIMVSEDPTLTNTLKAITTKLKGILVDVENSHQEELLINNNPGKYVAEQLRTLKAA